MANSYYVRNVSNFGVDVCATGAKRRGGRKERIWRNLGRVRQTDTCVYSAIKIAGAIKKYDLVKHRVFDSQELGVTMENL